RHLRPRTFSKHDFSCVAVPFRVPEGHSVLQQGSLLPILFLFVPFFLVALLFLFLFFFISDFFGVVVVLCLFVFLFRYFYFFPVSANVDRTDSQPLPTHELLIHIPHGALHVFGFNQVGNRISRFSRLGIVDQLNIRTQAFLAKQVKKLTYRDIARQVADGNFFCVHRVNLSVSLFSFFCSHSSLHYFFSLLRNSSHSTKLRFFLCGGPDRLHL